MKIKKPKYYLSPAAEIYPYGLPDWHEFLMVNGIRYVIAMNWR